jgi:hypothetical protein
MDVIGKMLAAQQGPGSDQVGSLCIAGKYPLSDRHSMLNNTILAGLVDPA